LTKTQSAEAIADVRFWLWHGPAKTSAPARFQVGRNKVVAQKDRGSCRDAPQSSTSAQAQGNNELRFSKSPIDQDTTACDMPRLHQRCPVCSDRKAPPIREGDWSKKLHRMQHRANRFHHQ
jgi:hypothetical protein